MNSNQRLGMLRNRMAEYRLDGYIITNSDPHFSEYLPEHYKEIRWLTGFTGSNALVLVTNNEALMWTDGRYFIQAEKQLEGSEFKMVKMATKGYPNLFQAIKKLLPEGRRLGLDSNIVSQGTYEKIKKACDEKEIELVGEHDIISEIWSDRPEPEYEMPFIHDIKYAGKTPAEKLVDLRERMEKLKGDVTIITSLEDIAWLYNIRGFDVKNNPVVTSYGLISQSEAVLFIDYERLSIEMLEHLHSNGIDYLDYEEIFARVNNLKDQKIIIDKDNTSRRVYELIDDTNEIINHRNLTTDLKAIKNEVEIKNQKNAYIKDGVALTKFIYWLKHHEDLKSENEYTVGEKLEEFRRELEDYVMPSFDTISAYKENGALMHYKAEIDDNKTLDNEGFLLVDSGGQYYDGTTDTTRTIVLGDLTEEEKTDFTLVLKGHLDLFNTIFLEGATGHALDAITRRPIWKHLMDYKSGTGHGVGYFLGVHEGPQNISTVAKGVPLKPGMVVTIEPGIYKEGKHGIRTENVALVVDAGEGPDGNFYKFEAISFVPIDREAIIPELLNDEEIEVLNEYHKMVFEKLNKYLDEKETKWLKEVTEPIK